MPSTCQLDAHPGQNWNASHTSFNNGRNDGFVKASGPVAMGYWDGTDIPFYYGLARDVPAVRPLLLLDARADVPEPAVPDRRHRGRHRQHEHRRAHSRRRRPTARSSTASTRTTSRGSTTTTTCPSVAVIPDGRDQAPETSSCTHRQFLTDAAAGTLPAFSIVDPDFSHQSEENPQDIRVGERFAADDHQRRDARPGVGQDAADLDLRRARRLLRPRAAAAARSSPTTSRPTSTCRPTCPARTTATASASRR